MKQIWLIMVVIYVLLNAFFIVYYSRRMKRAQAAKRKIRGAVDSLQNELKDLLK